MLNNLEDVRACFAKIAERAECGCGNVYELYACRVSAMIEAMQPQIDPAIRAEAVEIAQREFDYHTPPEIEALEQAAAADGLCPHFLEPRYCPLGCGDRE